MVKEGRSYDRHMNVITLAAEILRRMSGTSAATKLTPHFVVKHSFDIANAFADELEKDSEELTSK